MEPRLHFGIDFPCVTSIRDTVNIMHSQDCAFCTIPLFHPRLARVEPTAQAFSTSSVVSRVNCQSLPTSNNTTTSGGEKINQNNDQPENTQKSPQNPAPASPVQIMVHKDWKQNYDISVKSSTQLPLTRSDRILSSDQWINLFVGKISPSINLDSASELVREHSRKTLQEELLWASHLSLAAIMLPILTGPDNFFNLAQCVAHLLQQRHFFGQIWVRLPTSVNTSPANHRKEAKGDNQSRQSKKKTKQAQGNTQAEKSAELEEFEEEQETWKWWNTFRTLVDAHPLVCVALELTHNLPHPEILAKWLAEPLKAIIIPLNIFSIHNGVPSLPHKHKGFLIRLFRLKVPIVFSGPSPLKSGYQAFSATLNHLHNENPPFSPFVLPSVPYLDYLQAPLQPLQDNLESQTYETFERDVTKYVVYGQAIEAALLDTKKKQKEKSPQQQGKDNDDDDEVVVMVVGAGRGPLVKETLDAAKRAKRIVKVYAIEKNPNAVITLKNRKLEENWTNVTIISSDMRAAAPPEKADILVSELLGSFGDNELSPECLDGAQSFLKEGGISIPTNYTSTLAPVSSHKLWNEVRNTRDQNSWDTPFVVLFNNAHILNKTQPCFVFNHPCEEIDLPNHNDRFCRLSFPMQEEYLVHGFAGFFDSVLYADIHLSIDPKNHTEDMASWFPIYFPLQTPLLAPKKSILEILVWRRSSPKSVWYEWAFVLRGSNGQVLRATPVQNVSGKGSSIGL